MKIRGMNDKTYGPKAFAFLRVIFHTCDCSDIEIVKKLGCLEKLSGKAY